MKQAEQNPFERAYCHHMTAMFHADMREMEQAEAHAAKALAEAVEHGFADIATWAQIGLGIARAELGRPSEGVALIRKAVTEMTESEARIAITTALTWLAWAQALDVKIADALETIDKALTANPEENYWRPEIFRVRGELRLKQGDRRLAEADFREALSLARKMGARSLNYARLRRSRDCCAIPTAATKPARFSPTSIIGSPKASTPPT